MGPGPERAWVPANVSANAATSSAAIVGDTGVPAGGSGTITVQANAPIDGSIPTATLSCTANGSAYSITLTLFLEPEEVPTLSQWAMILLALGMFGIGFMTLRRRDNVA